MKKKEYENHGTPKEQNNKSEDPFGIYELLKKNKEKEVSRDDDPIFPPGFTPDVIEDTVIDNKDGCPVQPNINSNGCNEGNSSARSGSIHVSKLKPGGSFLEVMENLVKVCQTIGFNMDGCMQNIETIIGSQGDFQVFR